MAAASTATVPAEEGPASGPVQALGGAWRRTLRDPFAVLLPAGLALLIQAAAVQLWWGLALEPAPWLASGVALWVLAGVAAAPLRASILGAGARAGGRSSPGRRRGLSLVGVVLLGDLLHGAVLLGVIGIWSLGAGLLLSYGLLSATALYGAACLLVGVGASFALRVRLAYAPVRAVDGGQAAWRALLVPEGVSWSRTAVVVLAADLLFAFGTLLAVAGALPGYALRDLAVQRLWEDLP